MSASLRQYAKSIAIHMPGPVLRAARYPRESLFVNGYTRFAKTEPSVLFFTVHKCASMLMARMLATVNRQTLGLTHLNLAGYFWDGSATGGEPVFTHLNRHAQRYFLDQGILYAPLRHYVDIAHLERARAFVMLRDPRDVLVSGYFSARYSHRPPANPQRRQAFLDHRAKLETTSLDDYAMAFAPGVLERYEIYRRHFPRDVLLTYEHMWHDFSSFIDRLAVILGIELDDNLRRELTAMAGVGDDRQDNMLAHRRKGTPGDFREKLRRPTVDRLSDMFSDILDWLYD